MAELSKLPKDHYVTSMAFTKTTYQDMYPSIDPANPELSLSGKVVIITGASRGIGARAMVPSFVRAGVKGLVLIATNEDKLAVVEKEVREANPGIATLAIVLDISDSKGIDIAFEEIKGTFGHADVLVNAAGICSGDGPELGDVDPDSWWRNFVRATSLPKLCIVSGVC
jgi:NAD(P)-dependent dehydrogenase (short-subunit alcohol dehydrogenase family)